MSFSVSNGLHIQGAFFSVCVSVGRGIKKRRDCQLGPRPYVCICTKCYFFFVVRQMTAEQSNWE